MVNFWLVVELLLVAALQCGANQLFFCVIRYMISDFNEAKIISMELLSELCQNNKFVDADSLVRQLKSKGVDPVHLHRIIGPTFKALEKIGAIRDTGRVKASERNSGNLIKVWRSCLLNVEITQKVNT